MQYYIIHDSGKTLCFVGRSYGAKLYYEHFANKRPSELIDLETLSGKDQDWYNQRQFIAVGSDVNMKEKIVNTASPYTSNWFSLASSQTSFAPDVNIGRGCIIYDFCFFNQGGVEIGDHSVIAPNCVISHYSRVGRFNQISPFTYLNWCDIGDNVVIGLRSTIVGTADNIVKIPTGCNFLMDSRVNMSIEHPGTYQGHRLRYEETSATRKIM